mmetsp:Transcript_35993/g.59943  ORF Transcript_35993/g.59943 Transcript_35993/m.59943 type:complete len:1348 (+) Transcript_35993:160-4203(+)|eukprot:CAMPEP_0184339276 /NCGR_PEP_ID=MMETSP1089-20130417/7941_1 /TAXON_ID=38269 ORGANISM="Gloeochaete wittrockiana, Strain SAG46.84" /NCGR_SAMPLE_ID=MMETSP1089 /ASSEMBLY_ACC=CAM_ASM_000445 /LENGTH=1347 /DNA_ID=CAMNT_0026666423 /DNA_START=160 /DNA_END=4203 /DNA_ORIENTATION=-
MAATDSKELAEVEKSKPVASWEKAWWISHFTVSWITPLVRLGRKGEIKTSDLELPRELANKTCVEKFDKLWQEERGLPNPSLLRVLKRAFWFDFLIAGIYKLFWGAFVILGAFYFVRAMLLFVEEDRAGTVTDEYRGWILACFFFLDCVVLSICMQQMNAWSSRLGIKVRSALLNAIYQKCLVVDETATDMGDIIALASVDCQKLQEACTVIHFLWSGPVEAVAILILLATVLKLSVLPGVGLILLVVPVQFYIGVKVANLRKKTSQASSNRVQVMQEVLTAAKLVKFYCWEQFFAKAVADIRATELNYLRKSAYIKAINLAIVFVLPPSMAVLMFSTYVSTTANLTASISFPTLSLFNTLRFPLVVLPKALKNYAESTAALERIQSFLFLPEMTPPPTQDKPGVHVENADFTTTRGEEAILKDISFDLPPGKLMALAGGVGAGKTFLMLSILGQQRVLKGSYSIGGRIAYVSQQHYIQNMTVRDNILFGRPYVPERYASVVFACALKPDFATFPQGDFTELGERGANLSGGQRQRIALARAVYADADFYVLDAPLSAVDQHTSNHIFKFCIRGILKGKTVLMSTHKVGLLSQADLVAIMHQGSIAYFGPYNKERMQPHLEEMLPDAEPEEEEEEEEEGEGIPEEGEEEEAAAGALDEKAVKKEVSTKSKKKKDFAVKVVDVDGDSQKPANMSDSQKHSDEERNKLHGWRAYIYWGQCAGLWFAIAAIAVHPITQTIRILNDDWIRAWTQNRFKQSQQYYMWTLACWTTAFFIALLIRGFTFYLVSLRAATVLHNKTFKRILYAPFSFFVVTPLGPIINCFSNAQDTVDETLPDSFHLTFIYTMILATTCILASVVIPYIAIVTVLLFASIPLMLQFYLKTARELKGLLGTFNGKVISHLSETLQGLTLIRAFSDTGRFSSDCADLIDKTSVSQFNHDQVSVWMSFRLDLVGSFLILATSLLCIGLRDTYTPPDIGLVLSNAFQALVFFTWVVKGCADVDSQISAVAHIAHYTKNTPMENRDPDDCDVTPNDWPSAGAIEYNDVVLSYLPGQQPALRGISFSVKAGEKIGVVGRTGSGKSTLLIGLFRLVEKTSGSIVIDGLDVSNLSLDDLRSRLAIIPQEPVMFKGTVRTNLDPLSQYSDAELWSALEITHLKSYVESLPQKLDTPVSEGGGNWSLGLKQLACLCRVVLKRSKILVLDEATSSVDPKTEQLVTRTIDEVFAHHTVITIAHRLDTIIQCDRILFLEKGQVLEFDSPAALLADPNSNFFKLVGETGLAATTLMESARKSFRRNSISEGKRNSLTLSRSSLSKSRNSISRSSLTKSRNSLSPPKAEAPVVMTDVKLDG